MLTIILVVYKTDRKKLKYILKQIDKKYPIIIVDTSTNYDFSNLKISKKLKLLDQIILDREQGLIWG